MQSFFKQLISLKEDNEPYPFHRKIPSRGEILGGGILQRPNSHQNRIHFALHLCLRYVGVVLLAGRILLHPSLAIAKVTNFSEGEPLNASQGDSRMPAERAKDHVQAPASSAVTHQDEGAAHHEQMDAGPQSSEDPQHKPSVSPASQVGSDMLTATNPPGAQPSSTATVEELDAMPLEKLFEMKIPNVSVSLSRTPKSSSDTPGTIYTWSAEEIETYGFQHLRDVLEVTPGVTLTYDYHLLDGGFRGFSNMSGIVLLINGRRVMNEFYKSTYLINQFPLNMVKRIEIVQGPISTLYGAEALQGVINLITKGDGELGNTANVDARYGAFNTKSVSVNWRQGIDDGSFIQAAAGFYETDNPDLSDFVDDTDRYSRNPISDLIRIKTTDPMGYGYFFSPIRNFSTNSAFVIKLLDGKGELFGGLDYYHFTSAGGIKFITTLTGMGDDQGTVAQPFIGGRGYFLERKLRVSLEYNYQYNFKRKKVHSLPISTGEQTSFALFSGVYGPTNLHRLLLQMDWFFPSIENQLYAGIDGFFVNYGHLVENINGRIFEPFDSPLDYSQNPLFRPYLTQQGMSVFFEDRQNLWQRLSIVAGLRYNSQIYHKDVLLPRAGLVAHLNDTFSLKYIYGTSFKTVPVYYMTKTNPNIEAEPSTMQTHECALVTRFMAVNLSILNNLSLFYNKASDYTRDTDYKNKDIVQTSRDFWTAGMEDQLKISFAELFSGVFGLSFVTTKTVEVNGAQTSADKVPHLKATAGAVLHYGFLHPWLSRLSTALQMMYVSTVQGEVSAPLGSAIRSERYTIDPYVLLNAAATLKDIPIGGSNRALIQLHVHNLLNTTYYHINPAALSPIQFLQEGLAWMIGIKFGY